MNNYYGIDFDKQREALLKSESASPIIQNIINKADEALGKSYIPIKMSEFMRFYDDGDRRAYEKKYYERRNDCVSIAAALWLTEDEKYIKPLIDTICLVCDEYTWCLPAHANMENNPSPETIVSRIDLANGETSKVLTEISVLVGDRLPGYVNERIEFELRRRIIEGLKSENYGWQNSTSNWAAVCGGSSAAVLIHFGTDDEIRLFMPTLYKAMDNFLRGYENDGCCREGIAYWSYGFGHFLYFAKLIHTYTAGEKNYFTDEKVKNIAKFFQKIRMGKRKAYCMSDSIQDYYADIKNLSFLRKIYGKDILYPEISLAAHEDNIYSLTGLLWLDADYTKDIWPLETTYFEDAQIYIKRTPQYSFAAKGGTNGEPHNHNDIGSFMIVDNDDNIPVLDPGRSQYCRDSFMPQTRYKIFVNGSQGHSVPIINGKYQTEGIENKAENVVAGENFFSLDIQGGYEEGVINKIHRIFEFCEDSVVMTDEFVLSENTESISERFISESMPEIEDGIVSLGRTKLLFEKGKYDVDYGSASYILAGEERTIYYIDFKQQDGILQKFRIEIKMAE